jgi:hypothetical protein
VTAALRDLEGQTTPMTGIDLPLRVTLVEADRQPSGLAIGFASKTGPEFDVWMAIKYEPLSLGHLRRRDQWFAWSTTMVRLQPFEQVGTPVDDVDDIELAWFETVHDLTFQTTFDHWRYLTLPVSPLEEISGDEASTAEPSEAWMAFKELGAWLSYSDQETSRLLGLGDKTAYGWRREGRPPQPRLARRLYEAHAFVRQLVDVLGLEGARTAVARGGDDSALALIAANRVAEAEARFADLIYSRQDDEQPIGAWRSGDEDLSTSGDAVERLPGGRRRVNARRGR